MAVLTARCQENRMYVRSSVCTPFVKVTSLIFLEMSLVLVDIPCIIICASTQWAKIQNLWYTYLWEFFVCEKFCLFVRKNA